MDRRLSLSLAGGGVAVAAVWIGVAASRTPPTRQIDSALDEIETTVRETAAGAQARAVELSRLPGLDSAIATDQETIHDLMTEEVAFRPKLGESIEIAQVERVGGGAHRLIIIPADAPPVLSASGPGQHLVADGDRVRVTAVVRIEPRGRAVIEAGLVGVAQTLDLSRAAGRFEALGIAARLETSRGAAGIGAASWRGGAATVERVLQSPVAAGAKLVVQVPRGMAWAHVAGALFLLLASVISALLPARRRARSLSHAHLRDDLASDTPQPSMLVGHQSGSLASSTTGTLAVGSMRDFDTTSTGGNRGAQPRSLGVPAPAVPRATAITIPTSLFVVDPHPKVARPRALPPASDPWMAEYRKLFREFVKLRRTCNESTHDLDRDRFVEALHERRMDLIEQNGGAADVLFRLVFDNGKAAVRIKVQDPQPTPSPDRAANG